MDEMKPEMMEMDENQALRQALLVELIDSMHGRLADKMFPSEAPAMETSPTEMPPMPGMEEKPEAEMSEDEPSDEEIEEMLKQG